MTTLLLLFSVLKKPSICLFSLAKLAF